MKEVTFPVKIKFEYVKDKTEINSELYVLLSTQDVTCMA